MGECRGITKEKKSKRVTARRASPKQKKSGKKRWRHWKCFTFWKQKWMWSMQKSLKRIAKHRVHHWKRTMTSVKCCGSAKRQQWWNQLQPNDVENEKEEADASAMQTKQDNNRKEKVEQMDKDTLWVPKKNGTQAQQECEDWSEVKSEFAKDTILSTSSGPMQQRMTLRQSTMEDQCWMAWMRLRMTLMRYDNESFIPIESNNWDSTSQRWNRWKQRERRFWRLWHKQWWRKKIATLESEKSMMQKKKERKQERKKKDQVTTMGGPKDKDNSLRRAKRTTTWIERKQKFQKQQRSEAMKWFWMKNKQQKMVQRKRERHELNRQKDRNERNQQRHQCIATKWNDLNEVQCNTKERAKAEWSSEEKDEKSKQQKEKHHQRSVWRSLKSSHNDHHTKLTFQM